MRIRFVLMLCAAVLVSIAASAQDPTIPVYTCTDGAGCAEAPTSGQLTANEGEVIIGEPQPSPSHYIVCDGANCAWSDVGIGDIDLTYGGDGQPWAQGEEIDLGPFDPESPITPGEGELPAVLDPATDRPYIVTCEGNNCTIRRATITFDEAALVFGEAPTGDAPYILCGNPCQWWSGPLPLFAVTWIPESGDWVLTTSEPRTQNCSVNVGPAELTAIFNDALAANLPSPQTGSMALTFSDPPQAREFFGELESVAGVEFRRAGLNTYRAILDESSDGTTAVVSFLALVESPTRISGALRVTVRNEAIGCTVVTPLEYLYAG